MKWTLESHGVGRENERDVEFQELLEHAQVADQFHGRARSLRKHANSFANVTGLRPDIGDGVTQALLSVEASRASEGFLHQGLSVPLPLIKHEAQTRLLDAISQRMHSHHNLPGATHSHLLPQPVSHDPTVALVSKAEHAAIEGYADRAIRAVEEKSRVMSVPPREFVYLSHNAEALQVPYGYMVPVAFKAAPRPVTAPFRSPPRIHWNSYENHKAILSLYT